MRYYSFQNPLFKKNLLLTIVGNSVVDSKFYYYDEPKTQEPSYTETPNNLCIIEMEFSNGIKIDFSFRSPRYIEVKESLFSKEKCLKCSNVNRGMNMLGHIKGENVLGINDVKGVENLKEIIDRGEVIKEVSLVKQNTKKSRVSRLSNPLYVNGICMHFEDFDLYVYHNRGNGLFVSNNCPEIDSEEMVLSSEYVNHGKLNNEYLFKSFIIPKIELNQNWITSRLEFTQSDIIEVSDLKNSWPNVELVYDKIQSHDIESLDYNLNLLIKVKTLMQSKQFGIADLKFGVGPDLVFKLLEPIDIVEPLTENILFIDKLIEIIEKVKKENSTDN